VSFSVNTRRWLLVWSLVCLVVVAVLGVLARWDEGSLSGVDRLVSVGPDTWYAAHSWWRRPLVGVEATFRTPAGLVYTVAAAALLVVNHHRRAATYVVFVVVLATASSRVVKLAVDRPRPHVPPVIHRLPDPSYPSGHATFVAAAAGIAIVLASLFVRKRGVRRLVGLVAVVVALLVGLDRLMLGVHHPTDVLGGYALGAFWVMFGAYVYDPAPALITARPLPAGPVPTTRKLACILNPVKVEDPAAFRALVDQMATGSGWSPPDWYETEIADPGRSMAEQAAISGADLVLVCGGDGTVRTVCGELAGTGIPVGVVPAGTGNLLARNLDLPLYLRSAVDVALNGQDRAIDLVKVSGDGIGDDEHYLVMAGMGFDAAIMEGANEQMKAKVGWLAYVFSGAKNMMFPDVRVEICVDEGPWTRHRARTIVIGNVGNLQAGLPLLPDATIDDGTIDLVLIYPRRFLSWLRVIFRVLSRNSRSDETVTRMTGRSIAVRAASDTPRQVDGDPIGAGRELCCVCLPGRLLVRAPR
jgi:diacylglycerol kinase family enzyme/membrane-associated phospholipid phosphatase